MRRGSEASLKFVTGTISLAKLSSRVSKHLTTPKAIESSPEVLLAHVQDLDQRLTKWHDALDPLYRAMPPYKAEEFAHRNQLFHTLYLHFTYQALIIATHGLFCYPWSRPDIQSSKSSAVRSQVQQSTERVSEASRKIILAVQRLEITAALPVWYVPWSYVTFQVFILCTGFLSTFPWLA